MRCPTPAPRVASARAARIGVVVHHHRKTEPGLDVGAERYISARSVRHPSQRAGIDVDKTGDSDPDGHGLMRIADEADDHCGELVEVLGRPDLGDALNCSLEARRRRCGRSSRRGRRRSPSWIQARCTTNEDRPDGWFYSTSMCSGPPSESGRSDPPALISSEKGAETGDDLDGCLHEVDPRPLQTATPHR